MDTDRKKSEWELVGKLNRHTAFSVRTPIESFQKEVLRLCPGAKSVSDLAVTSITNDYLEKHIRIALQRKYPYLNERRLESAVGMTMLNVSLCNLPNGDYPDFHLFRRIIE